MTQFVEVTGRYRNKDFTGTVEVIRGYTLWVGRERRVGTAGAGYVKVRADGKTFKVTVSPDADRYGLASSIAGRTRAKAEIAALMAKRANETDANVRANIAKQIKRREAKLTA